MAKALSPQQRARYETIRRKQGAEAAKRFRANTIAANNQQAETADTDEPQLSTGLKVDKWSMTPEQKKEYNRLKKNKGQAAAKAYRDDLRADAGLPPGTGKKGGKGAQEDKSEEERQEGYDEEEAQRKQESQEETKKLLEDAGAYGDTQTDKYIPSGTFGTIGSDTSPAMQAYLDRLNQFAGRAYQLTDYEQRALDALEGGMAGYEAPEVQAMREAAMQEVNRQYSTALEQQQIAQARAGVRGAAAAAQTQDLGVQRTQTVGNIERDLVIQNAQEAQARKQAFASLVRQTEDARFGRKGQAESLYGASLGSEEAARTGREMYNVNQATNEAMARAGFSQAAAGTYAGLYQGLEGAGAQQDWINYMKEREIANQAFIERMTKLSHRNAMQIADQSWNTVENI